MNKVFIFMALMCSLLLSKEVAIVKSVQGTVEVKRQSSVLSLQSGSFLYNGDVLMTQSESSVSIIFDDGSSFALGSKSFFTINNFVVDPAQNRFDVDLNLSKGSASFESGKIGEHSPESFKFHIPEGIVGIRGTKFFVDVD